MTVKVSPPSSPWHVVTLNVGVLTSRYRKVICFLVFGLTIVGLALSALVIYDSQPDSKAILKTSSPNGIYTIALYGREDRPTLPIVDHSVVLEVVKRGKPFLSRRELYSGDWLDASFKEWYPQHQWVTEQSLQFYKDQFRKDLPNDSVTVANNSSRRIRFLRIMTVDLLIVLDFEPKSTATFSVSRARSDLKWTSVEGEFEGGQPITGSSRNLDVSGKKLPVFFRIDISDDATTIEGS